MPVRLLKPYEGQAANTLYWASGTVENALRSTGLADDFVEQASDYAKGERIVTGATANTVAAATTYRMNSGSAQTLTVRPSGYWPRGTVLTIIQAGAGAATIVGDVGVTIASTTSGLVTQGQNKAAQLVKGIGETWAAYGSVA